MASDAQTNETAWVEEAVAAVPTHRPGTPRAAGTKGCCLRPHSWEPRSARRNKAATRRRSAACCEEAAHPKAWPQRWACGQRWA